jgi:outer membrane protein assembly complex protein YaeT
MKATDRVTGGAATATRTLGVSLAVFFLAFAVSLAQAPADKVYVADVIPQFVPQGSQNVPTQRIMSLIQTKPGAEYKADVVHEDVRKLYDTKLFADVRVVTQRTQDNKIVVYFQLKELPGVIREILYLGANHLKKDDLESTTGLKVGAPLNPWATQKARQAILAKYQEKGRLSASVDILEGDKVGDTRIVFSITEGPVAKVGSTDFVGNHFVSSARLRTQINTSRSLLGIGGDFNPMMADNDVTKLEEYYRHNGFHDVQVRRELQWDANQRYVHLVFHIDEGPRYKVGGVDVVGVPAPKRQELMPLVSSVKPGEVFNQNNVDKDKNRIKDWLGYQGKDAVIQEAAFYPPDRPGQVIINYEVQERPPSRVGQIFIAGNDVTRDNVILRQVPLYPGQPLTYPDLRVAERNLARLNIFQVKPDQGIRPTVSVLDDNNPDNPYKDVLINVQEDQTGSLLFGIGVNSDAGLTGTIVLNERNFDITRWPTSFEDLLSGHAFRGAGQEFRIEAVPGTDLQRYSATWREPFLFDSDYALTVAGYYYNRIYDEYREGRVGTRISVDRKLSQYWRGSIGVRVEGIGVHDVASFEPDDYQRVVGNNFLVAPRIGVTRDTRDSYLRPTEGSLVDISFEEALGDFTFPIFNIEANKFWTTYQRPDGSGRHVLAFRSQLGIEGSNAPVYERFFAGGYHSLRGFEFRGVGPEINGFRVGGDFMFLNSLEYQVPVTASDALYAVAFLDSGTVESSVELRNYRVAAGFGLRITVPMLGPVPIALDFGFPIVKAPGDRNQVFSFFVGYFH